MNVMFFLAAGCALSASIAIAAVVVWYLYSRNKPTESGEEPVEAADPIASRGPVVVLPNADDISEGPVLAPSRPAPQPVVIAPQGPKPAQPPPAFAPAPQVAPPPPPVGVPPAAPRPAAQAMPRPNVAPSGRNIVERVSPAAPPAPAAAQAPSPPPAPESAPPPAPRPPPGVPAGVTIVPNDLTPFGMQSQPRGPAVRTKVNPNAAPAPGSDRKKDGKA